MGSNRWIFAAVVGFAWTLSTSVAAEPTKFWVFLGTFTAAKKSEGIYRCEFDTTTGKLGTPILAARMNNPSFLAIAPNQKSLYATGEVTDANGKKIGGVHAFALDPATGELKFLNAVPSEGAGPCHVNVDRTGKNVLVANYGSGTSAVLPIQPDGSLGKASSVGNPLGKSVNPQRQERAMAHSVNLDPSNRYVFVADVGLNKILIYRFNADQGTLTATDTPFVAQPGAGPRHFAFAPSGKLAFVINEQQSTLTSMKFDPQKGTLTEVETLSTLPKGGHPGNSTAEVVVHPNGKFVYGSNRGHNSIAVFAFDPESGKMTFIEHATEGIKIPRNFNIDPTGKFLLVANQEGDSVVVFRIDPMTGKLQPTGESVTVGKPVCVRFVPRPSGAE